MTRLVPVRRALGAVLTAGVVLAGGGLVAMSGAPAAAQVPVPPGGATPSPTTTPTSPSPSPVQTVSPSPSATPTACTGTTLPVVGCVPIGGGSPSPSATATATTSTTPSPPAVPKPTVVVSPKTIVAVEQKAVVSGTTVPDAEVQLFAYSRPSTKYVKVRTTESDADGRYSFLVGPSSNTRLYVKTVTSDGEADSDSTVLMVKTSLNLKVVATGTGSFRFSGSLLPKRPGQLVTVFYESGGKRIIAGRTRNAANGSYVLNRTFTGGGTFVFFTGTGADNNNAANTSNRVRVTLR